MSDNRTSPEGTHVQLHGVRRVMFEHLTRAHEIPAVTWVEECDFSGVDLKKLLPLVLAAVAESLKEFPELNGRVEGGELVLLDRYDLGIAVQTEQGLVVPIVRGADALSLDELEAEVRRLAEAAQTATLKPEELRGGTFTITSAGKAAGLFVTPLINHPEVAILGIHRIDERAVVRDGEVVARPMGNVSVTFDHRVIDGKRAADFGLAVIARLQRARRPHRRRCPASISSMRGAVARPSRRETTRFPTTSASAGTASTRNRSAISGCSSMSTLLTDSRSRSRRAICARRLSIRRAGPERWDVKKTRRG